MQFSVTQYLTCFDHMHVYPYQENLLFVSKSGNTRLVSSVYAVKE